MWSAIKGQDSDVSTNIRLGCTCTTRTNAQAYYPFGTLIQHEKSVYSKDIKTSAVKRFIIVINATVMESSGVHTVINSTLVHNLLARLHKWSPS